MMTFNTLALWVVFAASLVVLLHLLTTSLMLLVIRSVAWAVNGKPGTLKYANKRLDLKMKRGDYIDAISQLPITTTTTKH